ncbi:hypothetical protein JCM11251_007116 [Rhodosporidiobolus azoricus]
MEGWVPLYPRGSGFGTLRPQQPLIPLDQTSTLPPKRMRLDYAPVTEAVVFVPLSPPSTPRPLTEGGSFARYAPAAATSHTQNDPLVTPSLVLDRNKEQPAPLNTFTLSSAVPLATMQPKAGELLPSLGSVDEVIYLTEEAPMDERESGGGGRRGCVVQDEDGWGDDGACQRVGG